MNSVFGQVIRVAFPERKPKGHEQTGERPALLIDDPSSHQKLESPMLVVVPITTTTKHQGVLRVQLVAGEANLSEACTILFDHITSVDASRVRGYYGKLEGDALEQSRAALRIMTKNGLGE